MPLLTAFSWFHRSPRSTFMFWKLNVYSAPINVGSCPIMMEVFFPGTSFTKPTGTAPKSWLMLSSVLMNGRPRDVMLYAPA